MSADVDHPLNSTEEDYSRYRALSLSAVISLLLGLISLPGLMFSKLLFVPLIGTGIAIYTLRMLQRRDGELAGRGLARTGLILCVVSFSGGIVIAATMYATEVPAGYKRISFGDLQPDPHHPELPIPPSARQLDGQKVFVKGYVYPGDRASQLKKFILVPDMGTCCFGGQPALTDMIEVTLRDPQRIHFSYRLRRLGGIFKVDTRLKELSGLTGVYYQLDADYVR